MGKAPYRSNSDRRLVRSTALYAPVRPDNVEQLLQGVRIDGGSVVHALVAETAGCGALKGRDRHELVFTTADVTCPGGGCRDHS